MKLNFILMPAITHYALDWMPNGRLSKHTSEWSEMEGIVSYAKALQLAVL